MSGTRRTTGKQQPANTTGVPCWRADVGWYPQGDSNPCRHLGRTGGTRAVAGETGVSQRPAPPELAECLRKVTAESTAAAKGLVELAVDLDESGRHTMASQVADFAHQAVTYLETNSEWTFVPASERVAKILGGTWEHRRLE